MYKYFQELCKWYYRSLNLYLPWATRWVGQIRFWDDFSMYVFLATLSGNRLISRPQVSDHRSTDVQIIPLQFGGNWSRDSNRGTDKPNQCM